MQGCAIKGHALVVGCLGDDRKGIDRDVDSMAAMLRGRCFAVDVRTGKRATRDGILTGYDELIANARSDRPAVFYYTGHGFSAIATDARHCQGICPADIDDSAEDDFRGITAWELSIKQALLTRRTRNVTVILDCCYASQMTRSSAAGGAAPRALPHPLRRGVDGHLRALHEKYGAVLDAVDPLGNPDVVRVLACGQQQPAFEYRTASGEYRGVFTDALLDVLGEVGEAQVSWAALENALRARVFDRQPSQMPRIDGPARRRLFALDEDDIVGSAMIFAVPAGFELGAGRLVGVQKGDVYAVMAPGARVYRPEAAIAEVEVQEPSATVSIASLRAWKNSHCELTQTAIAIPIRRSIARRPIRLEVPPEAHDVIADEIAATDALDVAGAEDRASLATLRMAGGSLTIEDAIGPLFPPARFRDERNDAIANLVNLAAAERLRELEGEHGVPADDIEIEWGTAENGQARAMPECGGSLGLGDRIYVRVKNHAPQRRYVHVLNIGLRGKISLLTKNLSAAGVELQGDGGELVLGHDGRTLRGMELSWPPGLASSFPRTDEIVVIVSSMPASLQHLETQERLVVRRAEARSSSMATYDGYFMKRLSYLLHPRQAVMADLPFEIDDDPLRQVAMLAPDAWIDPSADRARRSGPEATISIQLENFTIDRRCAILPAVRLDALICTRSTHETATCSTWTRRYRCDGDHELLGDTAVVFRGPVHDFVSFCLWVSRDAPDSPDLAELFARRARDPAVRDAVGALMSRDVAVAAAAGGSAVLSRVAGDLLLDVAGTSIRLFRTALDAPSGFGLGRDAAGTCTARGVSFALAISRAEPSGA